MIPSAETLQHGLASAEASGEAQASHLLPGWRADRGAAPGPSGAHLHKRAHASGQESRPGDHRTGECRGWMGLHHAAPWWAVGRLVTR